MKPSGANAADWQLQAVVQRFTVLFPGQEVDHVREPGRLADLFRVIDGSTPRHQVRIRRTYFDDHGTAVAFTVKLSADVTAERLAAAGNSVIELESH